MYILALLITLLSGLTLMLIWDWISRYMRKKLKSNQLKNDALFVFLMICIMATPLVVIILTFIIVIRDGFLFTIFFLSMIISAISIGVYESLKNKRAIQYDAE